MKLFDKDNEVKLRKSPIEFGILPLSEREFKLIETTLLELQMTPLQLQAKDGLAQVQLVGRPLSELHKSPIIEF